MKNLTKVLAVAVVAAMALSSVSVFAAESEENMTKSERPAFSMKDKDNGAPMAKQEKKEKPSKVAMTEEKTAKIEKLKTDLATKLEAGEITQEEYDDAVAEIEAGNFKLGSKDGRNLKGERKNFSKIKIETDSE